MVDILKTLTLVRGVPGSGKTTTAQKMVDDKTDHFEADMFFTDRDGNYNYNPRKKSNAHKWCQKKVKKALKAGRNVVVSNTFLKRWEMEPYIEMAIDTGADLQYITCEGGYQNIHGVPEERVEAMRDNLEEFEEAMQHHDTKKQKTKAK